MRLNLEKAKDTLANATSSATNHPQRILPAPVANMRRSADDYDIDDDDVADEEAETAVTDKKHQEEPFLSRPEIRIPCPDHLKSLLVDDWENITKNLLLVSLPAKIPANALLDEYYDDEKVKRREGSAESDVLDEVVAGLKEYFAKCLGRILLYRFEREQYAELRKNWEAAVGNEWENKGAGDCYGAEHLTRLIGKRSCYPALSSLTWTCTSLYLQTMYYGSF